MTAKPDARTDLQTDLLADLRVPPPERAPTVEPAAVPPPPNDLTPTVSVHWTPLRWSRPRVVRAAIGPGKAVKVGPLKVELSVKK